MKRQIPGLHSETKPADDLLKGLFLVRVDQARYSWHREKPFFAIRFAVLEPQQLSSRSITGRIYCTPKALWRLNWFLRDFGYDPDLLGRDEVDEKLCLDSKGLFALRAGRSLAAVSSTWTGSLQRPSGNSYRVRAVRKLPGITRAL